MEKIKNIILTLILGFFISFTATHANAFKVDLGTPNSNSPAWTTKSECTAIAGSNECARLADDCGGFRIYSNQATVNSAVRTVNKGKTINVNRLVDGRFAGLLCKLRNP